METYICISVSQTTFEFYFRKIYLMKIYHNQWRKWRLQNKQGYWFVMNIWVNTWSKITSHNNFFSVSLASVELRALSILILPLVPVCQGPYILVSLPVQMVIGDTHQKGKCKYLSGQSLIIADQHDIVTECLRTRNLCQVSTPVAV